MQQRKIKMTNTTKTAFAVLALVSGLAGFTPAQAGQGIVMLGGSSFADRCTENGGELFGIERGYGCDLGTTLVECTFAGAHAACEWNGVQNQIKVVRLIGMLDAQSISSQGFGDAPLKQQGGGNGGGGGGIQQLDLDIKNK
jgi:hypothetical protein